jgi:hypothetical protein
LVQGLDCTWSFKWVNCVKSVKGEVMAIQAVPMLAYDCEAGREERLKAGVGSAGRAVPLAAHFRHGRLNDWDQAKAEHGALMHEVGEEMANVLIGQPQSSGRFTEAGWLHRPQVDDWTAHQIERRALIPLVTHDGNRRLKLQNESGGRCWMRPVVQAVLVLEMVEASVEDAVC